MESYALIIHSMQHGENIDFTYHTKFLKNDTIHTAILQHNLKLGFLRKILLVGKVADYFFDTNLIFILIFDDLMKFDMTNGTG